MIYNLHKCISSCHRLQLLLSSGCYLTQRQATLGNAKKPQGRKEKEDVKEC